MFSLSTYIALFGGFLLWKTLSSLPEGALKDTMTGADWGMVIFGGILIAQYVVKITFDQDKEEKLKKHLNAGIKLKEEKKFNQALEEFDRAVSLNKKYSGPVILYLERAKVHMQQGNRDLALNDLNNFIQMATNTPSLEKQIEEANNMVVSLEYVAPEEWNSQFTDHEKCEELNELLPKGYKCQSCSSVNFDYDSYWKEFSCSNCGYIVNKRDHIQATQDKPVSTSVQHSELPKKVKRICPKCNYPYNLADYDPATEHIYCSECRQELPQS